MTYAAVEGDLGRRERYDRRVLAGLMRLPVARASDLSLLLDMASPGVQDALLRLRERGWARDVVVSTLREDAVQVWLPSAGARAAYAAAGVDLKPLAVGERSLDELLWDGTGCLAVAELVGRLAHGARQRGLKVGEALRLRPPATVAAFAGAQGMVLLLGKEWCTPVFVLVDRQDITPGQRRQLARSWTRLLAERPFMAGAMLLLVTPTREEMDQWDFYLSVSRHKRGTTPPPVYMATASALAQPWESKWERPEGKGAVSLYASLHRLGQVPLDLPLPFRGARPPVLPVDGGTETRTVMAPRLSRAAKRLLLAAMRHPGSRDGEVTAFAGLAGPEAEKALAALADGGLLRSVDGRWLPTKEGEAMARRLAGLGSRRRSIPTPPLLPHHLEARAFLAALAQAVQAAGGKVLSVREAPATQREWHEDGRLARVVPDATAAFVLGGRAIHLLLEWDRGSTFQRRWQGKLERYRSYYRYLLRYGRPLYLPYLLVVAPDPTREGAIAAIARQTLPAALLPLFWTSNQHVLQGRGPLGRAWRPADDGSRRPLCMAPPVEK